MDPNLAVPLVLAIGTLLAVGVVHVRSRGLIPEPVFLVLAACIVGVFILQVARRNGVSPLAILLMRSTLSIAFMVTVLRLLTR